MEKSPTYEILKSHLKHHNPKRWLLEGARREDANTIRVAVERLSHEQLVRRLARVLSY